MGSPVNAFVYDAEHDEGFCAVDCLHQDVYKMAGYVVLTAGQTFNVRRGTSARTA